MENASHPASPPESPEPADPTEDGGRPIAPATSPAPPLVTTEPTRAELDAHGFNPADYEWLPMPRRRRADGWSFHKQREFIETLSDTGSVSESARVVGMSVQSCYRLRRAPGAEGFASAWDAAMAQAGKALLDIAFDRVIHGEDLPIFDKTGQRIAARRRYSDRMMMFLLRGFFPDRFGRDRLDRDEAGMPATARSPEPMAQALARIEPALPEEPQWLMAPGALSDLLANQREAERFAEAYPEVAAREAEQARNAKPYEPPPHDWEPYQACDQSRFDPRPPEPPVHDWVSELRISTSEALRERERARYAPPEGEEPWETEARLADEQAEREVKRRRKKGATP